ncbi:MAG: LamG-like jellyroll fold domain-containing protein [Methylovirgula sp.]
MLLLPTRRGQVKPPGIPRINWAHPIAQGLILYAYDAGGNGLYDLVGGIPFMPTGAPPRGVSALGAGYNFASGKYFSAPSTAIIRSVTAAPPWTCACAFPGYSYISGATPFYRAGNHNSDEPYVNWDFQYDIFSANFGFLLNSGGNVVQVGDNANVAASGFHSLVGVANSGSSASFFVDGANNGTTSGLTIESYNTLDDFYLGGDDSGGDTWGSRVLYGAFWNRALSPAEILQLHLDPYCFLIFPEDEIFVEWVGSSAALYAVTALWAPALEFRGAVASKANAGAESGAGTTPQFHARAELLARTLGFDEVADEALGFLRLSTAAVAETLAGIAARGQARSESEASARSIVRLAAELLSSARGEEATAAELGAGVLKTGYAGLESLGSVRPNTSGIAELLIGVSESNFSSVESAASVEGAQRGAYELTREVGEHLGALAEIIAGVRTDAAVRIELFTLTTLILQVDPRFLSAPTFRKFASRLRRRIQASSAATRTFTSKLRLPMPQGPDFSAMDIGETVTGAIDFAAWIPSGVSIASISSVVASNYYPAGGAAYVTLVGSARIGTSPISIGGSGVGNAAILQQWMGVNSGIARITVTVVTSDGQILVGWAHQKVGQPN